MTKRRSQPRPNLRFVTNYRASPWARSRAAGEPQRKYTPAAGVIYPRAWPATDLSDALKDTAQLIKADVGTDVVSIDFSSWNMRSDYGTTALGDMQNTVQGFAGVLDAFMRDLGDLRQRVTLVTISEFGRRIKENGNRGLYNG